MNLRLVIAFCIYFFPLFANAQKQKGLSRLLPDQAKLQFAGGIGFLSAGFGYESRNKKIQGDVYYGYVPEEIGGITIHSLTGKITWTPISRTLKKNVRLDILSTGLFINYVFGKQYFFLSPENYPLKYYGLPTAAHAGIFIGEGVRFNRLGLYYEIGTNDKDLGSYVPNASSLKFTDILNMGIGLRLALKG
jgi:hypothetical protein